MPTHSLKIALALLFVVACSDDPISASNNLADTGLDVAADEGTHTSDAGPDTDLEPDAGPDTDLTDTGMTDTGMTDAEVPDASMGDAGNDPLPGFGVLTGDCGLIDPYELLSSQPFDFTNTLDFGTNEYDETDFELLSTGGQEVILDGNAGGNSLYSEVFAYEVLYRCEMATLLKTETEVIYDTQSKITDLLVEIDDLKIGVSVVRAVSYPRDTAYNLDTATNLLNRKLGDILLSSESVSDADAWQKQILHVIVDRPEHIAVIETALASIAPEVRADTIVVMTVTEGLDDVIFF